MRPNAPTAIQRDGRTLLLAMDHGLEHGPTDFEPVPDTVDPETVFDVVTHPAVTAMAVGKGIAETYYPSYEDDVALVAKLNGATNLRQGEPVSPRNMTVDYAAELGADAVGYTLYPGSNHEPEMFEAFRDVQERAREYDLPVVLWSYPRGQGVKNDTTREVVAYAARVALELGADVTKVKHPGSRAAMEWATRAAGEVDVLVSGGSRVDERAFLDTVRSTLDAGGTGLAVGRNVWQRERPERMLDALERVIFDDERPEAALAEGVA